MEGSSKMSNLIFEDIRAINPDFVAQLELWDKAHTGDPKYKKPLDYLDAGLWKEALLSVGVTKWQDLQEILGQGVSQSKEKFNHPEKVTQADLDKLRQFYSEMSAHTKACTGHTRWIQKLVFEKTTFEDVTERTVYGELCSRAVVDAIRLLSQSKFINRSNDDMTHLMRTVFYIAKELHDQQIEQAAAIEQEIQEALEAQRDNDINNETLIETLEFHLQHIGEKLDQTERVLDMMSVILSNDYELALDALVRGISADGTSDKAAEVLTEYISPRP